MNQSDDPASIIMNMDELSNYMTNVFKEMGNGPYRIHIPILCIFEDCITPSCRCRFSLRWEYNIVEITNDTGAVQFQLPLFFNREYVGFIVPFEHTVKEINDVLRYICASLN